MDVKQVISRIIKNCNNEIIRGSIVNNIDTRLIDIPLSTLNDIAMSDDALKTVKESLLQPISCHIVNCLRRCDIQSLVLCEVNDRINTVGTTHIAPTLFLNKTYQMYLSYLRQQHKPHFSSCHEIIDVYLNRYLTQYLVQPNRKQVANQAKNFMVNLIMTSVPWNATLGDMEFWALKIEKCSRMFSQATVLQVFKTFVECKTTSNY